MHLNVTLNDVKADTKLDRLIAKGRSTWLAILVGVTGVANSDKIINSLSRGNNTATKQRNTLMVNVMIKQTSYSTGSIQEILVFNPRQ